MCALCEHLHISLIVGVDLRTLEDLQADGTILVVGEERASTRLTDILHHATYTHRTVELTTEIVGIHLVTLGICAEALAHELGNLLQLGFISTGIECAQVFESLLLQRDEYAGDDLFPLYGLGLQAIGHHIVDILDEDDIGIDLVEILDESTMTAGAEEQ